MNRPPQRKPSVAGVVGPPLALAAISAIGLVAAFALGPIGEVLCWLGVGAPVAVVAWFGLRSGGLR
ncbi:exported hypothetical protein [Bradyrhizobium sp. STM 3843]|uniref:hypothetical protein n=1 Tax=Bradyrhizobium sp. STM 3843 TaxID=551947 RepID=UPI0002404300|nr:hypothetical protein [Bradyrhizobium sp. STM 3843]CCE07976.1 exported hypothetical protein [Bradyrhizobium sp. STM 3843]